MTGAIGVLTCLLGVVAVAPHALRRTEGAGSIRFLLGMVAGCGLLTTPLAALNHHPAAVAVCVSAVIGSATLALAP